MQSENPSQGEATGSADDEKGSGKADSVERAAVPTAREIAKDLYSDKASLAFSWEEQFTRSEDASNSPKATATSDSEGSVVSAFTTKDGKRDLYRSKLITGPDGSSLDGVRWRNI